MIDPAEEDGLRGKLHQLLNLLSIFQQVSQARAVFQGDLVEQTNTDDLPQQAENKMGLSCKKVKHNTNE